MYAGCTPDIRDGRKESNMKRIMALIVAAGMVMVIGGVAFAGGDGACSYGSHNQAATDKTDASKNVAVKASEKADSDKVVIAQTEKPAQPTPEVKK